MVTVKLCKNCKGLPNLDMHFDYEVGTMTFRFFCPHCGLTSMSYLEKGDAALDWNERCKEEAE